MAQTSETLAASYPQNADNGEGDEGVVPTQRWNVRGEMFVLEKRYSVLDYLGSGAYGVVCAAFDKKNSEYVAVKKCKKIFQSRTMAKRALREMRILRLLQHDNVISIKRVLQSGKDASFREVYCVFEIMETDLAVIIRSSQVLRDQHLQFFVYQLLCGLQYLQDHSIVHRDIKPRNLLVNTNCQLKIADFGLARVYKPNNETKIVAMTEYVTTRWYRAPEVIVGWHRYDFAVDMWAVGTILAELLGRQPIFAGSDSSKQLDLIIRTLGRPQESFIELCRKPDYRKYLRIAQVAPPIPLSEKYAHANPCAIQLLEALLVLHPSHRPSASQALKSRWMQPLLDGTEADLPITIDYYESEFAYEDVETSCEEIRLEMLREIQHYRQGKDKSKQKRHSGARANSTGAHTSRSVAKAEEEKVDVDRSRKQRGVESSAEHAPVPVRPLSPHKTTASLRSSSFASSVHAGTSSKAKAAFGINEQHCGDGSRVCPSPFRPKQYVAASLNTKQPNWRRGDNGRESRGVNGTPHAARTSQQRRNADAAAQQSESPQCFIL